MYYIQSKKNLGHNRGMLHACRCEYTHNYIHCIIDLTQLG